MDGGTNRVVVVPCSGIGKTFGSVSREAAYALVEDLRPETTRLAALALLVMGDEDSREAVRCQPTVTIDGCKLGCAAKMVRECGGEVGEEIAVLDVYRRYRQYKPQGISELNKGGLHLAQALAEEAAQAVDRLAAGEGTHG